MRDNDQLDHLETIPVGATEADGILTVPQLTLEVRDGATTKKTWRSQSRRFVLGSHPTCELVIDDPSVSRFHCEISLEDDRARVRDLGSRNGTRLDGAHIVEGFLRHESVLRIGRTAIGISFSGETARLDVASNTRFGSLVGRSLSSRRVFTLLRRAAESKSTVLIEGETGTGKTVAARAVHDLSDRSNQPFVVLDCGAVPENLLESELLGHEKGAFTGADRRRAGAFEEANHGTLLIDEIGELRPALQPKLLGVLESREVRPVGGNRAQPIDVRVIAATNRDLRQAVNAGAFRSDLYYRLAVLRVRLPALRERPDDIPLLARHLLEELGALPAQVKGLWQDELTKKMRAAPWPGNARQLRNYLERCLVFEQTEPVPDRAELELAPEDPLPFSEARRRAVDRFERGYLRALLERHQGKVVDAAAEAAMDRTYFYRLLRRHGLTPKA